MCVGFTSARTVTLSNMSDVPLTFRAHVPDDGSGRGVCFDRPTAVDGQPDDENAVSDESIVEAEPPRAADTRPQEFTVQPSSGVLEPRSDVTFTVTLCPNFMSQYSKELAVNFDEVSNETFTIPVTAEYAQNLSCWFSQFDI